jgi:(p)ppGpp synthase/HD superfamily hydrolase
MVTAQMDTARASTHTCPLMTNRGSGPMGPKYVEAFEFAADVHHDQFRKGTTIAYLSHVMSVSALVLEDGGTEQEAIAGLLHDTIEDGPPTGAAQISDRFGDDVLQLVLACSDDAEGMARDEHSWRARKTHYVQHLEIAPLGALRVTAADKLHNTRCTVDDLRIEGEWPKSNACVHQHLWYYATVSEIASRRLPDSRTAAVLDRTVTELCEAAGQPRPKPSSEAPLCATCDDAAP